MRRTGVFFAIVLLAFTAGAALGADPCLQCHGLAGFSSGARSQWVHQERFQESPHSRLACADCHKGVEGFPHRQGMEVRCDLACHVPGAAHGKEAEELRGSVHGKLDKPACLACHTGRPAPKGLLAEKTCVKCHEMTERPRAVFPDTAGAFAARAHGRAGKTPGCRDCHGSHNVKKAEDARASCAAADCHKGRDASFGLLFDHKGGAPVEPLGMGRGMLSALCALVALFLLSHALRTPGGKGYVDLAQAPERVEILDAPELLAHGAAALGLCGALATGPLLRLPALAAQFGLTEGRAAAAHGASAVLILAALALHAVRVTLLWLGGRNPWLLAPRFSDLGDMVKGVLWGLGLGKRPNFGQAGYRERLPYALMLALAPPVLFTGMAVGFPSLFGGMLGPKGIITAASVHAALGFGAFLVLLCHVFFALFQPGALWWNGAFLTGKMGWRVLARTRPDWAASLCGPPPEEEAAPQAATEKASVESLLDAGNRMAREGRYSEAAALYEEALALYPGYSQALFNLGVARVKAGDKTGGRDALTKYLEIDGFGAAAPRARDLLRALDDEEKGGSADG